MDQFEEDARREVKRICRAFLELSIESYKCFNQMIDHIFGRGNEEAQAFARKSNEGLVQWLRGVAEFTRYVKRHIQDGRVNLLAFIKEAELLDTVSSMHKKRYETKTELLSQIEEMVKGVFDLTPVTQRQAELLRATKSTLR